MKVLWNAPTVGCVGYVIIEVMGVWASWLFISGGSSGESDREGANSQGDRRCATSSVTSPGTCRNTMKIELSTSTLYVGEV